MKTSWKITQLRRKPLTGLVFTVAYAIDFEIENEFDFYISNIELEGDETSPNFIPFENLTEEIVLGWVKNKLGEDKIKEIENDVKNKLENRIYIKQNPSFFEGLPWV